MELSKLGVYISMKILLASFLLVISISLLGQEKNELDSLLNLSAFEAESELQKQLNQATGVASGKELPTREIPGILSVITAEEIKKVGYRDLVDVLRSVPGFDVMQDVDFTTGPGFRGLWANEGKVLFLLDGIMMNELRYQTVSLLNNFPLEAIEKIEIIRGPGSAIYGGSAEYSVINIVSRQASQLNGIGAYSTGGFARDLSRFNSGFFIGQALKNIRWDLGATRNTGLVSDRMYQDLFGEFEPADLSKTSEANVTQINLGLNARGFQFRGIFSKNEVMHPQFITTTTAVGLDASYRFTLSPTTSLTSQVAFYNQTPWQSFEIDADAFSERTKVTRLQGGLTLNQNIGRKTSVVAGALLFQDKPNSLLDDVDYGNETLKLNSLATFAQLLHRHRLFNITLGARYEHNNKAGDAFVPRLAFTKRIVNFHFKALYSQAFRAPAIENINYAKDKISPERSQVAELEFGYQFTPEMLLSLNMFDITTKDVIIYEYDAENEQAYVNSKKIGSRGFEAVYAAKFKKINTRITYSFAEIKKNDSLTFTIPQTKSQYVGFSKHKVTLMAQWNITPKISLTPSAVLSSKRFAYTAVDIENVPVAEKLPGYGLVNLFARFDDVIPGLSIGFGVFDLLNDQPPIVQPYNGETTSIPGLSREWILKIQYKLDFKTK